MPYYLYACDKGCDVSLQETFHSIYENPVFLCSICQSPMVRIPQVASAHFKGNGWGQRP